MMAGRADARILVASLIAGIGLALLLGVCIGTSDMPLNRVLAALLLQGDVGDRLVVWSIRLPRALAALVTGVALGLAGAALQGLLRNPLAEPGVLGVSASASLCATIVIYFGLAPLWAWAVPVAAIVGALLATGFLAFVALRVGSAVSLILVGVGLSSFAGAVMALAMNFAPNPFALSDLVNWMGGSVANRSFEDLGLTVPFIALGCLVLMRVRHGLSALTLGEEAALGVGLDVRALRLWVVAGTGLVVGGSVGLAGAIGFVGLICAHLVRPLVQHDPARTLLPAGLLGGLVLLCADILVRVVPSPSELKLGVVAALIGAPVFVWIAARSQSGAGAANG
ncbi:MAG: hypothetical protein RLZZ157_166 [Pseudomonadota bacterium]|jgi:iron complex transport system permease protein